MPQFESTGSHGPFNAENQKHAVLNATKLLGDEAGGTAKLDSCNHDGDHSACVATITTQEKGWEDGEQVLKPKTEIRRFVVKPRAY